MTDDIKTEVRKFGDENIEVVFRKSQPLNTRNFGIELQTPSRIEFKPGSTLLKKGTTFFGREYSFAMRYCMGT